MTQPDFVPEGYYACSRCGRLVVEGYQHASIQTCTLCVKEMRAEATDPNFPFEVEGRTFHLKPRTAYRSRPKPTTPEYAAYARLYRRAVLGATRRLKLLNNPLYQLLLAEEKAKFGLDPVLYWSKDHYDHTELRELLRERDELEDAGKLLILSHDREDRAG